MEVGIDIVEHERFVNYFLLKEKILSNKEKVRFESFGSEKRKLEYVASRFAVKEALYKAYPHYIDYKRISVLNDDSGKPYILIDDKKREEFKISLSHENNYSVAIVYYEEEFI